MPPIASNIKIFTDKQLVPAWMMEEQQDLPIDFNIIPLYTIGNNAGNITGIII